MSVTGPRAVNLQQPLQDTLDNVSASALKLGIEFSAEKTELLVFSRKRDPPQMQLLLLGRPITRCISFNLLFTHEWCQ